jgi:hypothetical protein
MEEKEEQEEEEEEEEHGEQASVSTANSKLSSELHLYLEQMRQLAGGRGADARPTAWTPGALYERGCLVREDANAAREWFLVLGTWFLVNGPERP